MKDLNLSLLAATAHHITEEVIRNWITRNWPMEDVKKCCQISVRQRPLQRVSGQEGPHTMTQPAVRIPLLFKLLLVP